MGKCRSVARAAGIYFIVSVLFAASGYAAPFDYIRIGDSDGFGYGATSLNNANGSPADANSNGVLEPGELLPDIDGDGGVATGRGDDFDNRNSETVWGNGFTYSGVSGTSFTDIALSRSYDTSSSANNVYDANTKTFGAGGAFPKPPSSSLTNQPGFLFQFFVADGDITPGTSLFFNLIFGDYDVTPAHVDFTRADGSKFTQTLATQGSGQDGLIQAASPSLNFSDVFTSTTGGYSGYLGVDFVAPNEPYTSFDYVEIGTESLVGYIPEPATVCLLGLGLLGLGFVQYRRRS